MNMAEMQHLMDLKKEMNRVSKQNENNLKNRNERLFQMIGRYELLAEDDNRPITDLYACRQTLGALSYIAHGKFKGVKS